MLKTIDASSYVGLLGGGIKNLERNRKMLNDLNVFPVPDGDTGTNMVMTLKYGIGSVAEEGLSLPEASGRFASSAVLGARGNSGVIVSQFFKGLADGFGERELADAEALCEALESGCRFAYSSVAKPVEGTMLTVIRDSARALRTALPLDSIDEAVDVILRAARASLENTPNLLPVLKKAGVVDSGGSGIVCFFEGVKKYLTGATDVDEDDKEDHSEELREIDLSLFNKETRFDYGYCVEGVIQLKIPTEEFKQELFVSDLERLGESIVISLEGDKVKLHIHLKKLGRFMDYCQRFGEFLTVKIDNMTVQNRLKGGADREPEKFLVSEECGTGEFAVVAVATGALMQKQLSLMGADVVIMSDIAPSSQDFVEAFELINSREILVFPNSSNSILTSMQAGSLYKKARITVLNSRSLADCYAALAVMDFDGGIDEAIRSSNETISSLYRFTVYHAAKDTKFGSTQIKRNEFFSLSNDKRILAVEGSLERVTLDTLSNALKGKEYAVLTVFFGKYIAEEYIEHLVARIGALGYDIEIASVMTDETAYSLAVTLE